MHDELVPVQRDTRYDLAFAVCLSILAGTFGLWKFLTKKQDPYSIAPCPNPQCVRCRRYAAVQRHAARKLPWLQNAYGNLDRVADGVRHRRMTSSIRRSRSISPALGQYPTVLLVPCLITRPIVTSMHQHSCMQLEDSAMDIQSELLRSVESLVWTSNDVSPSNKNGTTPWQVLHMMNQGRWNDEIVRLFPKTWSAVTALGDALLDSCMFGNVFFSRLTNGTCIDIHCGPTNVRHRLHLTVHLIGELATLHVRDELILWNQQYKAFVFDDSLPHYVTGGAAGSERIVLIVDLWHPDLSVHEREMIRQLYPNKFIE